MEKHTALLWLLSLHPLKEHPAWAEVQPKYMITEYNREWHCNYPESRQFQSTSLQILVCSYPTALSMQHSELNVLIEMTVWNSHLHLLPPDDFCGAHCVSPLRLIGWLQGGGCLKWHSVFHPTASTLNDYHDLNTFRCTTEYCCETSSPLAGQEQMSFQYLACMWSHHPTTHNVH